MIDTRKLPLIAIQCGSDLRALQPHEVLGSFVGLRARHIQDIGKHEGNEAKMLGSEPDWLLARQLFPSNRMLYKNQIVISTMRGDALFELHEAGHPSTYAKCLDEVRFHRFNQWQFDGGKPASDTRKPTPQAY